MNSLLKKRLPGILAVGLVALAVGAASAPATASVASASALTKSQAKKKKAELKKCGKKKTSKQRSACKKAVNKKYAKLSKNNNAPVGKTFDIDVGDDYFNPTDVSLKVGDAITWNWKAVGGYESHNVTLQTGPAGVSRGDYQSATTTATSYTFTRAFPKPGNYLFVCTFHQQMTMNVTVTK